MSYILEALKKAQAERQIGNAPDIHTAPLQMAAAQQQRASRQRTWIGAGAVGVVVVGLVAWWMWPAGQGGGARGTAVLASNGAADRGGPQPTGPAQTQGSGVRALVAAAAGSGTLTINGKPAKDLIPSTGAAPAATAPQTAAPSNGIAALATAPQSAAPPTGAAAPAPAPLAAGSQAAQANVRSAAPAGGGASGAVPRASGSADADGPAQAAAQPARAAAPIARDPDDSLPTARELPEPIRQSLPQVTLGGYIYASNPADRLVLIDKTLRHEGEDIAPGLTLERLLPRYAVLNFRGTRYRVPY